MWTSVPSVSDFSDVVVAVAAAAAGVVCSSNNFTLLALLTFVKFSSRLAAFGLCFFIFYFGFLLSFCLGVFHGCGCCASAKADKLFSRFFYDAAAAAAACCGLTVCVCVFVLL